MRRMLIALVFLAPGAALAQDAPNQSRPRPDPAGQAKFEALVARIQDFQRRHSITVNGSDNPAALRSGTLLRTFFAFGPLDDVSFAQFALERYGATGSDTEILKEARDAPDAEIEDESDRNAAAPYRGIIDRLSPRVRANVLQKLDEYVVGMSSTNLDHLGMAQEDPDLYKTMVTGFCSGKTNALPASQPDSPTATNRDSNQRR